MGIVMWYRVFGGSSEMPAAESIRAFLSSRYGPVGGSFAADDSGWYQADLVVESVSLQLERYLADEPGIRAELNSWAAWLEVRAATVELVGLMERLIQTAQLITLRGDGESTRSEAVCLGLCRFLAEETGGIYQIDARGLFAADGRLLIEE
ncbi:MAG: hypothetical protein ACYC3I_05495 [Gemmataceae bacterium]